MKGHGANDSKGNIAHAYLNVPIHLTACPVVIKYDVGAWLIFH